MGRQQSGRMEEDGERRMDGFDKASRKSSRKSGVQNFWHQTVRTNKAGCCPGTQLNTAHRPELWRGRRGTALCSYRRAISSLALFPLFLRKVYGHHCRVEEDEESRGSFSPELMHPRSFVKASLFTPALSPRSSPGASESKVLI